MAWGAVLGIIAGIMIALYALPPILRSIYGEQTVSAGSVYEAEGKRIEVVAVAREGDTFEARLMVRSSQTWDIDQDDWQLEVSTADDWIRAMPADPALPDTTFAFELGEERVLLLRFPAPGRVDARAVALHLASPRLKFELP